MFRAMLCPSSGATDCIYSIWQHSPWLPPAGALDELKLIQDTSRQQPGWTPTDTVNTVNCPRWWVKTSPETCRADKEKQINLYSCISLVTFIIVSRCTDSWTSTVNTVHSFIFCNMFRPLISAIITWNNQATPQKTRLFHLKQYLHFNL